MSALNKSKEKMMNDDILIDLGPEWGHVIPLSVLEQIVHIEYTEDKYISVSSEIPVGERTKNFRFKSRKPFDEKDAEDQKSRLIGLSNGVISRDDVGNILKTMSDQMGTKVTTVLEDPVYDISLVRKLWADHMGVPYFRFVLQYDTETNMVLIQEGHNDMFQNTVLPEWTDKELIKTMTPEERTLLFAYEVLYQMVEPVLPEDEFGPSADIPTFGGVRGSHTTKIDLANIDPDQVLFTSGGDK